ncbi:MAG TPA: LysR family transcriptional regulator [Terracidiphilus sp.]|nr:LysR family transcriptional regulator [Terracidiphilus sp.]
MPLPEMRLVQSAIVLAEELHFFRAAVRLGIDQSALTKRIMELESLLDVRLFERNHQKVELTEAGAKFVEHARQGVVHIEDAVTAARAAPRGTENILNVGRSAYTDPWLAAVIRSVQVPLYPGIQINWSSNYSHEVARYVIAGTLDLALITGVPETPKLSFLKLAEHHFYIAISSRHPLAAHRELRLADMHNRTWVMFSQQVSPYMYSTVMNEAKRVAVASSELHHVTGAEEAVPLILERDGLAFLTRTGAWRIARDGITMRPLAEENLKLVTNLAVRPDTKSRLVKEFVKATARKLESLRKPPQARLPLSA